MAALEYKEYLLSTDPFNKPAVANGDTAIAVLLTRIILLEPGTDPIHPTMGVGLISKYRHIFPNNKDDLLKRIQNQIATFLPHLQCAGVELVYNEDKTIDIKIRIDDTIYIYDSSTGPVPITLDSIKNN